jgi:anti-sigma-K factor RskA
MTFQPQLREGAMYDEDQDALAAEYVLGTLSVEERGHAEALLLIDTAFVELVHQWERRLGELNVMVESVEPPSDLWNKIKPDIGTVPASDKVPLAPIEPVAPLTRTETATQAPTGGQGSSFLDALASKLLPPGVSLASEGKQEAKPASDWRAMPSPSPVAPAIERGTEAFYLARRARLWRITALAAGVLALALAAFIALSQVAPELVSSVGFNVPRLFAATPAEAPGTQLVAVLQQEPTAPAFLLTVDPDKRSLTVRRLLSKAAAGHSYELWIILQRGSQRRSLGLVGDEQFTQRPLPGNLDPNAMLTASYEISYEPAGGSKKGAPSGPILFTGKMVQAVPAPQPPQ